MRTVEMGQRWQADFADGVEAAKRIVSAGLGVDALATCIRVLDAAGSDPYCSGLRFALSVALMEAIEARTRGGE